MEREKAERASWDSLSDATGLDTPEELPATPPTDEETQADRASSDEETAVTGTSALGAAHHNWGGQMPGAAAGMGTPVPAEGEEQPTSVPEEEAKDSTDPRGH